MLVPVDESSNGNGGGACRCTPGRRAARPHVQRQVALTSADEVDAALLGWIRKTYDGAG
jgi:hypothetical protein